MKKTLLILSVILITFLARTTAQTAHFEVKSTNFLLKSNTLKGTDSLTFSYIAYYHKGALPAEATFDGTIHTYIITGKNNVPLLASLIKADSIVIPKSNPLKDLDSVNLYGVYKLNSHYFDNNNSNIIVVWPTGARTSGQTVACIDSIHYLKKITVSGLADILNKKNTFDPVRIFPNPSSGILHLEMNEIANSFAGLHVFDSNGNEVFYSKSFLDKIDLSGYKSGLYFVKIICKNNQEANYKIIIED